MPGSRKILRNFHCKVLLNFLRVLDVFLELLSDSKNHVDFLVDEISELGHTVKSLCCRHLENFGSARHSEIVTKFPQKVSFKPNLLSVEKQAISRYAQARRIRPLQNQNNFYNRFAYLNKHRILSLGLNETFCGNLVTISAVHSDKNHLATNVCTPLKPCGETSSLHM